MPSTTNFNWTTPADTDLVKDGAAAIRTLGNGIDTSLVDLKGGTTGQILSKNSNTDLDYIWINNDQGDITAVTAGTGLTGGGTTGAVTLTNDMATTITAKGDLLVGTGNATYDNLAVGTNGYTLVADSSTATGLKWAAASSGGYTLINTGGTTLSGSSVSITSIAGTYRNLEVVVVNFKPSTDGASFNLRYNNDSSALYADNSSNNNANYTANQTYIGVGAAADDSVAEGFTVIRIYDYANSTSWKVCDSTSIHNNNSTTSNANLYAQHGVYRSTSAITEINLYPQSGNFTSGTVYVYGVK